MLRSKSASPAIGECLSQWPQSLQCLVAMTLDSPLPMFAAWGRELRLVYNDSYAAILGPRHPAELCAPAEQVWADSWFEQARVGSRVSEGEVIFSDRLRIPVETPTGPDVRWFTFSISPLRDLEGNIGGIVGIGADITETVLSDDRLLSERNRIRDLLQQAPGFMAMGTGRDHVIEFANDAFFSLVGDRELVGLSVRDALPELEGQGFFELLDEAYSSGTPFVGREIPVMLARQGTDQLEKRYIDTVYQPIKQDGDVVGILAEGYDVTEQKKAKEELLLLQSELIHVSRLGAMSAMAATLAHELNQPLTAIKAYVAGARRRLDADGATAIDEVKSALREAGAASMRAGEIIRRLRTMVRRGEPEVGVADLGMVVKEAVALGALGVAVEGVRIREEIASDVPVSIDRVQIQQVVLNLLRNAIEATFNADRREIRVSVARTRGSALLRVDDSGHGIDPGEAETIFSPLFTTKAAGLGVGLSISRTIVEAHRGTMWADNGSLGGACLSVKLPLAPAVAKPSES